MQNKRIVVLVVLIFAAALVLGYLIGRTPSLGTPVAAVSAKAAAKPADGSESAAHSRKTVMSASAASIQKKRTDAPDTPTLKSVYADLKRRADANDADAAAELYRDLSRCHLEQELGRTLPTWLKSALDGDTSKDTPEQLKQREEFLDSMQKEVDFVQRNQAFCADADPDTLAQLVPATLKAAQLGDINATRCYLSNVIQMVPGLLDHPEWITDFKQNAVPLAQFGVEHGDWRTVALLAHAYRGTFSGSLLTQAVKADPVQAYQYTKLLSLGSSLKGTDPNQMTEGLTAEQIAQADAAAQDMYVRYFNSTPDKASPMQFPCTNIDD